MGPDGLAVSRDVEHRPVRYRSDGNGRLGRRTPAVGAGPARLPGRCAGRPRRHGRDPAGPGRGMIKRLLVANRGEVAVRVMATAAVLGIETVAVYPADDAACGHVGRADAAVELPGAGAAAYLDVDAIIAAATGAGCDMVHPGYGFLSERPELAARCAAAGLRFAGPGPEALALFGDKTAARARAWELGVPVLAGTGAYPSPGQVLALLRQHGAVMVKAVAGGSGSGLRAVTREECLPVAMWR